MSSKQSEYKKKGIDIFLRVRPSKKSSNYWKLEDDSRVQFDIPTDGGTVQSRNANHDFRFNHVLKMDTQQDEVFARVASDSVRSVMNGFNATIFAYGQTGSGKTFTITGGPERYVDRGIIPRSLTMMFEQMKERTDAQFQMHISYLEIYNNTGYDLLDPSHETKRLEDLPRVTMREDGDGNVHLRGLSTHLASTEEEALNLLFLGDTNRAIAETPMNMASSRSHCIFTVFVESREAGSDVIRRSKLHLVDLAGSERVHKTNSSGSVLREAQHINQSLHFLEVVILALHEKKTKGREHIPYRNSMMTSVLRDSLGGNCKTVMIATINPEARHTDESVSTCRFAQRVALIENTAKLNEQVDPTLIVKRLKQEIRALQEEVAYLKVQLANGEGGEGGEGKNGEEGDALLAHEERRLREQVQLYVDQRVTDPRSMLILGGPPSFVRVHTAFRLLREIACEVGGSGSGSGSGSGGGGSGGGSGSGGGASEEEMQKLRELLDHRDNEISILVNMVKRGKTVPSQNFDDPLSSRSDARSHSAASTPQKSSYGTSHAPPSSSHHSNSSASRPSSTNLVDMSVLADKRKSFDVFRRTYSHNRAIEENKTLLRQRYDSAKEMGLKVNEARSSINSLKGKIESLRVERANQGGEGKSGAAADEEEYDTLESNLQSQVRTFKIAYKENFSKLRNLKGDVERIQGQLQKQRVRMQKEFELWHGTMLRNIQESGGSGSGGGSGGGGSGGSKMHEAVGTKHADDEPAHILTGDKDVDRDILQFFAAKKALLKR